MLISKCIGDFFEKNIFKYSFLSLISICVVVSGIMISCMTGRWHWFARSGAILIIIGLILPLRNLVRKGCRQYLEDINNIDCGKYFNYINNENHG